MEQINKEKQNADLAAALFCGAGGSVPHKRELEEQARALAVGLGGREKALEKAFSLCTPAKTPQQRYLAVKTSAWLGARCARQTIEAAETYLAGPPWEELPSHTVRENGIAVDKAAAVRASVLCDLAKAQQNLSYLDKALESYTEAYRLEPYNAMHAVKAADVILRKDGKEQALMFLRRQRKTAHFTPLKYADASGASCLNDAFKQILNAHILKLEESK